MLALPAFIGGWLGRRLLKNRLGRGLGTALGGGVGVLWVLYTFYENISVPRPQLTIDVPAGFAHDSVIFITDPKSPAEVTWQKQGWLFPALYGRIAVPSFGVLRLRTLGVIDGGAVQSVLSDGRRDWGGSAQFVDGARVVSIEFAPYDESRDNASMKNGAAFAAYVHAREAEP